MVFIRLVSLLIMAMPLPGFELRSSSLKSATLPTKLTLHDLLSNFWFSIAIVQLFIRPFGILFHIKQPRLAAQTGLEVRQIGGAIREGPKTGLVWILDIYSSAYGLTKKFSMRMSNHKLELKNL